MEDGLLSELDLAYDSISLLKLSLQSIKIENGELCFYFIYFLF